MGLMNTNWEVQTSHLPSDSQRDLDSGGNLPVGPYQSMRHLLSLNVLCQKAGDEGACQKDGEDKHRDGGRKRELPFHC